MRILFLVLLVCVFVLYMPAGASAATPVTVSNIEAMTNWHDCSTCANGAGTAVYSMTQHQASPSLNGNSTKFSLGGTVGLSDALWYRRSVENSKGVNFKYDLNYYYTNPSAPSGMEFSTGEHVGYRWYRWDWQCSFVFGVWRTWDNANGKWVNTTAPCTRPVAYTWTHTIFEGHRYNGKVYFDAVTVNGHKYYVNFSCYPKIVDYSGNWVTIHFQLNGDKVQTPFNTWANKINLTYW